MHGAREKFIIWPFKYWKRLPFSDSTELIDEARHKGIQIDLKALERELGVPVVSTVALTGEGIAALKAALPKARPSFLLPMTKDERWRFIGDIVMRVQMVTHRHHTFRDRLEDISVHPLSGMFLSLLVIIASFYAVRIIGEGLINYLLDPFFNSIWGPFLNVISNVLGGSGFIHDILIGHLNRREHKLGAKFRHIVDGIYVEFAMVFPYISAFYLVLSLLEDIWLSAKTSRTVRRTASQDRLTRICHSTYTAGIGM